MNYTEENKKLLIQHFEDGCKANCIQKLGVEIEHFIVNRKTGESIGYYGDTGVEKILEQVSVHFPKKEIFASSHLIGMYNNDYSITIEPAGQLEISIMPRESIQVIRKIYKNFLSLVLPVLDSYGYDLITSGYHPVSRAIDMPLIPKKRYEYMDEYFTTSGDCGYHMMRGTASTQVSIDFFSEKDFVTKYRVAYQLMPIMKFLTDNTPVFDGKPYSGNLARTYIWDHVDPSRCGIPGNLFEESFGFASYAEYLWNLPLIFITEGDKAIYTKEQTAADLWNNHLMTDQEIDHILSMTFLDVRLKHYIEIRFADSMPIEYVMAYTALIKGLFFSSDMLASLSQRYPESIEEIKEAQRQIQQQGADALVYGKPVRKLAEELIELAKARLSNEEKEYLQVFEKPLTTLEWSQRIAY